MNNPLPNETIYTKTMKKNLPFFGIGSILYAVFYTFCLYKNASGITYPFFVTGTLCYFFFSMKKLGVPYKKGSIFYLISILLLGISNCLTNSFPLLIFNKIGIFFLTFFLILHTMYNDSAWNLPEYIIALCRTIGNCFSCLLRPFSDAGFYFDTQKQEKTDKNSSLIYVFIGILITIPVLFVAVLLLFTADAVFADILNNLFHNVNFKTIFSILFLIIVVSFCSYAAYAGICMKTVPEKAYDRRTLQPVIAIIVTGALSFVYIIFSSIQILYLFVGNMQLPDGYTYARYAREGFFQLLAVCILNLLLVLICLYFFQENTILKIILTIINGCTYIMILSSALRMVMYINSYHLTFLRIFVLWSLAVIFLLISGITVSIYCPSFPLFSYGIAVITVCYLILSFVHPDYWIARYNLTYAVTETNNSYYNSLYYLNSLSADAAPVILNPEQNPYLDSIDSMLEHADDDTVYYTYENENDMWLYDYYNKIYYSAKYRNIRNFNFSLYHAEQYLQ